MFLLKQILIRKDILKKEYNENLKLTDNYRVKTYFTNSLSPGRTFGINEDRKALWFKNPGNTTNEFKKEKCWG